jgi:hypothetical protein
MFLYDENFSFFEERMTTILILTVFTVVHSNTYFNRVIFFRASLSMDVYCKHMSGYEF